VVTSAYQCETGDRDERDDAVDVHSDSSTPETNLPDGVDVAQRTRSVTRLPDGSQFGPARSRWAHEVREDSR
jgi:hypothetical protein